MNIMGLLDFGGARKVEPLRQAESSECGLACLAMVASFHGLIVDLPTLRRRFNVSMRGIRLSSLMDVADRLGLSCRALRCEIGELDEIKLPAILHWDFSHFVVLTKVTHTLRGDRYYIVDPAVGTLKVGSGELSRHFTGVAIEFSKSLSFKPQVARSSLRLSQLWSSVEGAFRALGAILVFSAILQVISLVMPFYLQLAIDDVLPSSDKDLLNVLAIGFGGIALISVLTSWLRSMALLSVNNSFSIQLANNLFNHLFKLPLAWFEKRHVGDIISRFGSTQPISDFLSQGALSAFIDGCMAFITLILMFAYSAELTGVALLAWLLYITVKIASFAIMRASNVGSISAIARENSVFIESVRGASTIKAFGKERIRQRTWQAFKAAAVNAQLKMGRLSTAFDAATGLIIAAEKVAFVYLAVSLAMNGGFTIGMIFAFQAYKQQFLDAANRLADQALKLRLIDVHLARLGDIVLSKQENTGYRCNQVKFRGQIELVNVSFRYGDGDPFVIRDASFRISPGEMVALVGPSGGGKTTLIKIMMGLLEPTLGTVLVDGQPLSYIGGSQWRNRIASVMQDGQLFAGSLAENIAFFDNEVDEDRVIAACQRAAIYDEIEAMPLGLDTLVGDMGSSLSGGQKQRVMLARAFYADADVLFMDEGTANLDGLKEATITSALKAISLTRIVSTHRAAASEAASRHLLIRNGIVSEIRKPPSE